MRTPGKPYDQKPAFGALIEKHRMLPFRRFADIIEAKIDDLADLLKQPVPFDQGPGRTVPFCVPVLFGPLPLTTARRYGDEGFEGKAQIASNSDYYTPRNGDILINRTMTFRVQSISAFGFVNWGYKADPQAFEVPTVNPGGVGDIFDPVSNGDNGPNGGAMPLDYFGGSFSTFSVPFPDVPNIAFGLELYDRLRGRRMHDKQIPSEMISGGRIANTLRASPLIFPQGSKIEPRLFVKEIRMGSVLNDGDAYDATSFKAWVSIVFKGVQQIEVP